MECKDILKQRSVMLDLLMEIPFPQCDVHLIHEE